MSALHHVTANDREQNGGPAKEVITTRELAPVNFYPSEVPKTESKAPSEAAGPREPVPAKVPPRKRPRSDSDLSDVAEEDAGSDFEADASANSDDSFNRYRHIQQPIILARGMQQRGDAVHQQPWPQPDLQCTWQASLLIPSNSGQSKW